MTPTKPRLCLCTRCQAVHSEQDRVWAKSIYGPFAVSHCPHCGSAIHTSVPPEKRQLRLPLETT